jgi:L-threonylcarbamoyladenylate synthase
MLVTLNQAVSLLNQGQVVAIPTETVYGLAADAGNDDALSLLYQVKGRPSAHPVILHVTDADMCRPFLAELPPAAEALMRAFWPGPLTLLLPRSELVSPRITGARPLVGVRAPAAPMAQEVIRRLGRPVVAPSANRFGHISPTSAAHVEEDFEGRVPVLDGGPCQVGLESTIFEVRPEQLVVMRPGQLDLELVSRVAGLPVVQPQRVEGVPGALKSHYAPRQPVTLLTRDELMTNDEPQVAILALTAPGPWPNAVDVQRMPEEVEAYARALYNALRRAEASSCTRIVVERPPEGLPWQAVHDRLQRASAH